jgi:hypothetical protein
MKIKLPLLLILSTFLMTFANANETAAQTDLVLRGVLDLGSQQSFSLSTIGGGATSWVEKGKVFQGYKVVSYDAETHALIVQRDGKTFEVFMAGAVDTAQDIDTSTIEERLAEAKHIMQMINFDELMDSTMEAQVEAMQKMMRQQMLQAGGEIDQELLDFQTKAVGDMFKEIDWDPIKEGMTTAYAEVFTKDELRGVSDFYATPAGKASIEKQPEVQQKMMSIMMPAIMESSQKMQKEMMEFMKQRHKAANASEE